MCFKLMQENDTWGETVSWVQFREVLFTLNHSSGCVCVCFLVSERLGLGFRV